MQRNVWPLWHNLKISQPYLYRMHHSLRFILSHPVLFGVDSGWSHCVRPLSRDFIFLAVHAMLATIYSSQANVPPLRQLEMDVNPLTADIMNWFCHCHTSTPTVHTRGPRYHCRYHINPLWLFPTIRGPLWRISRFCALSNKSTYLSLCNIISFNWPDSP